MPEYQLQCIHFNLNINKNFFILFTPFLVVLNSKRSKRDRKYCVSVNIAVLNPFYGLNAIKISRIIHF